MFGHKEGGKKHKGFHGSPHETHEIHGGKHEGPKELTVGAHPGKMAMGIKPHLAGLPFEGGKGGKVPKTGKSYSEE